MPPKFRDLTGKRFGRLTAITRLGSDARGSSYWQCKCDCGNTVKARIDQLTSGMSKSCGCLKREVAAATTKRRNQENKDLKYGALTHGESRRTRLYSIWNGIKQRCLNPNDRAYKYYGGRGITVYKEWMDFIPFRDWAKANGYDESLEIDREDNDGNYEPDNCRWVTHRVNMNNTRRWK